MSFRSDSSMPNAEPWTGDEPDPYRDEDPDDARCGGCGEMHCRCDEGYDPTPDPEVSE
jgi:hypothetical protein